MDDFITQLNFLKQEFSLFQLQILKKLAELEKRPDTTVVLAAQHQDILSIIERLNALNPVFHNINTRLDAHGKDIQKTTACLDTILVQTEENRVKLQNLKPTISIWPSW